MPSFDKKVRGPEFFQNPAAEESNFMNEANEISTKTLMPVFNVSGCCGHLLRTARISRDPPRLSELSGVNESIVTLIFFDANYPQSFSET